MASAFPIGNGSNGSGGSGFDPALFLAGDHTWTGRNTFNGVTVVKTSSVEGEAVNNVRLISYAAKLASQPLFAEIGEAVDGGDLRLLPKQSIILSGGFSRTVTDFNLTDYTWCAWITVPPVVSDMWYIGLTSAATAYGASAVQLIREAGSGRLAVLSRNGTDSGLVYLEAASGDLPVGLRRHLSVAQSGGMVSVYLDGVLVDTDSSGGGAIIADLFASLGKDAATTFGPIEVSGFSVYNVSDITSGEYRELRAGRTPARLASSALSFTGAQAIAAGAVGSGFTVSGNTVTRNSSGYEVAKLKVPGRITGGMRVRLRCNANVGATLNMLDFAGGSVLAYPVNEAIATGPGVVRTYTVRPGVDTDDAYIFFTSETNGDAITVDAIEVLGTVAAWAEWTSLGRGIDRTGRYDLSPGGGVTALRPILAARDGIRCNASSVSVSANSEASVTLTAISDAARLANVAIGDAVDWTPDSDTPAGLLFKSARVTAAGTVQLRYFNPTESSISSGSVNGTLGVTKL